MVVSESGTQRRYPQFAWEEFLAAQARSTVGERTFDGNERLVGNTTTIEEEDHLLLHRVKGQGEWLSVMNWDTGEWRELESKASEGYLETSVICFLPFGNIVGIMQGSTSAPSHKALESWLNAMKVFGQADLTVRALISPAQIDRLRKAEGANKIEIRMGARKIDALNDRNGRLAGFLKRARQDYGDINVTLIISVPKGKGRSEDRQGLLNDLIDLEHVMPGSADKARATLVYAEPSGAEYTQLAEFVEHHVTAKRRVPAVDTEGNSIRILSAVDAILGVAAEHEAELRLAVSTD
ncbi:hypothetical protein GT755_11905 [Herbidospora sp. NEAU-GS84]|uniref:Uncharacterized protein n=1 Tax=Herbidospora solisilvae TaxID=2696284 RepID=A0A7C9J234_9ACTN|nr:hypothetical protein [Herbidospora solisilvae]